MQTETTQSPTTEEPLASATVPDITNYHIEYAKKILEQEGFTYSVYYETSEECQASKVIRTDPAAGSSIPAGDQIHIYISKGAPAVFNMEDCTGMTALQAKSLLEYYGITVEAETAESDKPAGTVIGQSIEPGIQTDEGDTVTLTIAMSDTFRMPDFAGMSYENAQWLLALYGLDYNLYGEFSDQPKDYVYEQSIPAGENVSKGSPVTLRYSQGQTAAVPDCTGMSLDKACQAITSIGLQYAVQKMPSDQPAMTVIAQDLTVGGLVELGTTITLTVADGDTMPMPDCSGLLAEDAHWLLQAYGLQEILYTEVADKPFGTVIAQSIQPGKNVKAGTSVELTISAENLPLRNYVLKQMPEPDGNASNYCAVRIYATEKISDDRYYAYTWVLEETCSDQNGELHVQSASSYPCRFELSKENGASGVVSAEIPGDGAQYTKDLKKLFPKAVRKQIADVQNDGTIQELEEKISAQAKEYFNAVITE
ncbi:MAG: PASTA domain-containing protein [Oscillospiraceae bacterium]|nr:PASTA domain-containing protein [Oscillospiraceae bacterium]